MLQSPILTEGPDMVLTPTYHVLDMYKNHQGATHLATGLATPEYRHGTEAKGIPALSVSASRAASGEITVTITNADPNRPATVPVSVAGAETPVTKARAEILTSDRMNAFNDFQNPNALTAKPFAVAAPKNGVIELDMPPMSVVTVTLS